MNDARKLANLAETLAQRSRPPATNWLGTHRWSYVENSDVRGRRFYRAAVHRDGGRQQVGSRPKESAWRCLPASLSFL